MVVAARRGGLAVVVAARLPTKALLVGLPARGGHFGAASLPVRGHLRFIGDAHQIDLRPIPRRRRLVRHVDRGGGAGARDDVWWSLVVPVRGYPTSLVNSAKTGLALAVGRI